MNKLYGAGNGNRTRIASLEGWNSTIELHLHFLTTVIILHYSFKFVNKFVEFFSKKLYNLYTMLIYQLIG
jgi:hypothetical protein